MEKKFFFKIISCSSAYELEQQVHEVKSAHHWAEYTISNLTLDHRNYLTVYITGLIY